MSNLETFFPAAIYLFRGPGRKTRRHGASEVGAARVPGPRAQPAIRAAPLACRGAIASASFSLCPADHDPPGAELFCP